MNLDSNSYHNVCSQETDVNLLIKQFGEHNITVYGTYDKPLFKAKDIGDLLGISNIHMSIKDFTDKQKVLSSTYTLGGSQESIMLTEQGVYKVLMRSRKPVAIQFQDWVCEVISEIRKTGEYKNRRLGEISKANELFVQQYIDKNVLYIGTVEKTQENEIVKYGMTAGNIGDRLKDHQKQYGQDFHLTHVVECDKHYELEKKIQNHNDLKSRHIKTYKDKNTQELLRLDSHFTKKEFVALIYDLKKTIDTNNEVQLKQIELSREQEKTKQIEAQEKTKQMELEIRLLELKLRDQTPVQIQETNELEELKELREFKAHRMIKHRGMKEQAEKSKEVFTKWLTENIVFSHGSFLKMEEISLKYLGHTTSTQVIRIYRNYLEEYLSINLPNVNNKYIQKAKIGCGYRDINLKV